MTKPFAFLLGIIFFCGGAAWAQVPGQAGASDEQLVRQWVATLGGDAFGGRKPMTPYEDITIHYLAGELQRLGLEPAFEGNWFQPFQMIDVTARPDRNKLTVKGKKKAELRYPDDLVVWTARAADKAERQAARIAQLEQQIAMQGVVRYPSAMTYGAGPSPFCQGCGCGNI